VTPLQAASTFVDSREGVALRREILRFLTRLRSQSGLAPVDFTRYTTMLS
jgi:hypothetical protein